MSLTNKFFNKFLTTFQVLFIAEKSERLYLDIKIKIIEISREFWQTNQELILYHIGMSSSTW